MDRKPSSRPCIPKKPVVMAFLIGLLMSAGVVALRCGGMLQALELFLYDGYAGLQPWVYRPEPRVVLVAVSEDDIQRLGTWPLPDGALANLLKAVLRQGPRAIGLDIYRDIPVPPGGDELVELFSQAPRIVTVKKLRDEKTRGVSQAYMVKDLALVGFSDLLLDPSGVIRRGLLFLDEEATSYSSLPFLLATLYLELENIRMQPDFSNPSALRLGKAVIVPLETNDGPYIGMDSRGYQFLLDYSSAKAGFNAVSLSNVLSGSCPPDFFKDKIVLIGSVAESTGDFVHIPFSHSTVGDRPMAGMELHALIVAQLLRAALEGGKPIAFIDDAWETVWIVLWGMAGSLMGLRTKTYEGFLLRGGACLVALTVITFLLFRSRLWVPVVPPGIAFVGSLGLMIGYLRQHEKAQKALLMKILESHVSKDVAEVLWQQRDRFFEGNGPGSQELEATVLFTDLVGYTSIAESMTPKVLREWLSEYMEAMSCMVMDHGGIVNKYIGDAILAVFGAPVARIDEAQVAEDARCALMTAVAMGRELERLNKDWRRRGLPEAKMRIGILTGPVVAGCLGGAERLEYTVLGDTVNTAARLESYDKSFCPDATCRILVGETTWRHTRSSFPGRELGSLSLKGKDQAVRVYHVLVEQIHSKRLPLRFLLAISTACLLLTGCAVKKAVAPPAAPAPPERASHHGMSFPAREAAAPVRAPRDYGWTQRPISDEELWRVSERDPVLSPVVCREILGRLNIKAHYHISEDIEKRRPLKVPKDFRAYKDWTPLPRSIPGLAGQPGLILVSKDVFFLGWYERGRLKGDTQVCLGVSSQPTLAGVYRVLEKDPDHISRSYSNSFGEPAWMPWSMRIYEHVWIHAGDITGAYCSHGCVTLPLKIAEDLFHWAGVGTPVVILESLGDLDRVLKAHPEILVSR